MQVWPAPAARRPFGQMRNGNTFGGTHQYGQPSAYFFGNLEGPMRPNPTCST